MPKQKKVRSKKTADLKKKGSKSRKSELGKTIGALFFLLLFSVLAGYITHDFILPERKTKDHVEETAKKKCIKKKKGLKKKPVTKAPLYEIYPELEKKNYPPKSIKPVPLPPVSKNLPMVAIIIDDLGYDMGLAEKFLNLNGVITLSVLPHGTFSKKIARLAREKQIEIMLHLPMEPNEYPNVKPGPGGILFSMTPDLLIAQLNNNIANVPYIKGVNNHMGSRITSDSPRMNQIFSVLRTKGLFFIDSRTTRETRCKSSARLFNVPFAERDVFLDHFHEINFIKKQIKLLIRVAYKNGTAVGIAHPLQQTYDILEKALPEIKTKVQLVPASKIVRIIGE